MNNYFKSISNNPNRQEKTKVREFLFSKFDNIHSIVGLGGPNINKYINWCKSKGYKNITIYENDKNTFLHQLRNIKRTRDLDMKFDNINNCDANRNNTIYDLDYCCTISSLSREKLNKFNSNFIITLSKRQGNDTMNKLFKKRNEKKKS